MRMSRSKAVTLAVSLTAVAMVVSGCSSGGGPADDSSQQTLKVWDYYGGTSSVKAAIPGFEKAHPNITVKYEALDWNSLQDKFAVAVSSGAGPDLATLDMTWLPNYAASGLLSDLGPISGGKINGKAIDSQYNEGATNAMKYDGKYVTALYDFDAYSLYYRADILKEKGLTVPTNWDEFLTTAKAMSEDGDNDGKADKYATQLMPDTFHYAQFLYQNGGTILNGGGSKAEFAKPAGVEALDYMDQLLHSGGIYWGASQGDMMAGIKDDRIGMFLNGPYMMGVLKSGAPEQSGKWAVAPAPVGKTQGSYLGGTGLSIPEGAKNPAAAWLFAQYLLQPSQQEKLFTIGGAAPATIEGLAQPALSASDPYFGDEKPFSVFQSAMAKATPFPYVAAWNDIDVSLSTAIDSVLLGKLTSQEALAKAAQTTDAALAK